MSCVYYPVDTTIHAKALSLSLSSSIPLQKTLNVSQTHVYSSVEFIQGVSYQRIFRAPCHLSLCLSLHSLFQRTLYNILNSSGYFHLEQRYIPVQLELAATQLSVIKYKQNELSNSLSNYELHDWETVSFFFVVLFLLPGQCRKFVPSCSRSVECNQSNEILQWTFLTGFEGFLFFSDLALVAQSVMDERRPDTPV